jgi:hypothetical protein
MAEVWKLDDYDKLLRAELIAAFEARNDPDLDPEELVEEVYKGLIPRIAGQLYTIFDDRSDAMLREHRSLRRGFVARNRKRWRAGFDLLERLIVISQETGSALNNALRPKAVKASDPVFEAVISNHARAIQTSREILTLMVAGFPDGAMGRWRTLHEIAVVSLFISNAGSLTAGRYILHDHVVAYRRAKNYMDHHERANLEPIEQATLDALKAAHDDVLRAHGQEMKHDYGWAFGAVSGPRPTFAQLEEAVGLDHWRPRYKWATMNTHGSYRSENSTLATCESEGPVLAVGESNSGMTDPAHMTAITLNSATFPVIALEPNLDRFAIFEVMTRLADEIGETFLRLDRETYAQARKRRGK